MTTTLPLLIVKDGPLAGNSLEVQAELFIGREGCDVTIEDPQLSRRHAVLRSSEGNLEIEDLGSLNGTRVNGLRITEATQLASGDSVRLGQTTIVVELPAPESSRTVLSESLPVEETILPQRSDKASEALPLPAAFAPSAQLEPAALASGPAAPFTPPGARPRGRVASRRLAPGLLSFATIVATAAALLVYFAVR